MARKTLTEEAVVKSTNVRTSYFFVTGVRGRKKPCSPADKTRQRQHYQHRAPSTSSTSNARTTLSRDSDTLRADLSNSSRSHTCTYDLPFIQHMASSYLSKFFLG